jgi:hypothetical protein
VKSQFTQADGVRICAPFGKKEETKLCVEKDTRDQGKEKEMKVTPGKADRVQVRAEL